MKRLLPTLNLLLLAALVLAACGGSETPTPTPVANINVTTGTGADPNAAAITDLQAKLDQANTTLDAANKARDEALAAANGAIAQAQAFSNTVNALNTDLALKTQQLVSTTTALEAAKSSPLNNWPEGVTEVRTIIGPALQYADFRNRVAANGDGVKSVIVFGQAYSRIVIHRAVADEAFDQIVLHRADGTTVDLLALLKMVKVTRTEPADASLRACMKLVGVNLNGELLAQNSQRVLLLNVQPGEWIYLQSHDVGGVNSGHRMDFSPDTTTNTVNLDGSALVGDPNFPCLK